MNKTLKKLLVLALAGATLCGPVMAAPHGGKGRAPKPAPRHQTVKRPPAPKHRALRKHHRPAPHHRHHHERHRVHHHHGGHHNGWVTLGAAVVGGLAGGLLGACQ